MVKLAPLQEWQALLRTCLFSQIENINFSLKTEMTTSRTVLQKMFGVSFLALFCMPPEQPAFLVAALFL